MKKMSKMFFAILLVYEYLHPTLVPVSMKVSYALYSNLKILSISFILFLHFNFSNLCYSKYKVIKLEQQEQKVERQTLISVSRLSICIFRSIFRKLN